MKYWSVRALVLGGLIFLGMAVLLLGMGQNVADAQSGGGYALRLYGNGVNGIDRVEIRIDNPAVPADIGATDFTLEWWMKAFLAENTSLGAACGSDAGWITGNILFDRDIFGSGDYGDFGVSLSSGQVVFGVSQGSSGNTLCGTRVVADGTWHHVAVTHSRSSGTLRIFVDGVLDAEGPGPTGDVSYRDGRATSNPKDPYLVIGAEKHDYDRTQYPSYSGWVDEVRLSTVIRYTGNFTRPVAPFTPDGNTAALYHFDEGPAGPCQGMVTDSSGAAGGPSNGQCKYGGTPSGPVYVSDQPFSGGQSTPTRTVSFTPTHTATFTPTYTATFTPTFTVTPSRTPSFTPIYTPSASRTVSPPPSSGENRIFLPAILNQTGMILIGLFTLLLFGLAFYIIYDRRYHHPKGRQ